MTSKVTRHTVTQCFGILRIYAGRIVTFVSLFTLVRDDSAAIAPLYVTCCLGQVAGGLPCLMGRSAARK